MPTIDAQVHSYERNHPGRPWHAALTGPPEVTGDQIWWRRWMPPALTARSWSRRSRCTGTTPLRGRGAQASSRSFRPRQTRRSRRSLRRGSHRGVEAHSRHRGRAHVTCPWRLRRGPRRSRPQSRAGGSRTFVTASQSAHCRPARTRARAHPPQSRYADHRRSPRPRSAAQPTGAGGALGGAAEGAGARKAAERRVKISGACTLSHEPFPYKDIWDPVGRVIDAFGIDRCMWGTDWTRAVKFLTYAQDVDAFRVTERISHSDRAKLIGGTLTRNYGWSPRQKPQSRD